MHDRNAAIDAFLQDAGWSTAESQIIEGDMSARRYVRLRKDDQTAILMIAESPQSAFVRMTEWLANAGLSVPRIHFERAEDGLLILEDFGDVSIKSLLSAESIEENVIFDDCITLLLQIRATTPPELPKPDAETLVDWTRLTDAVSYTHLTLPTILLV